MPEEENDKLDIGAGIYGSADAAGAADDIMGRGGSRAAITGFDAADDSNAPVAGTAPLESETLRRFGDLDCCA